MIFKQLLYRNIFKKALFSSFKNVRAKNEKGGWEPEKTNACVSA